jgi:hypothetical protein
MAANTEPVKSDLQKALDDLRKLGEEIRRDLQAAGEDARRRWKERLEPQLAGAEKLVREVSGASREALARTTAAFREFKQSLTKSARPQDALKPPEQK